MPSFTSPFRFDLPRRAQCSNTWRAINFCTELKWAHVLRLRHGITAWLYLVIAATRGVWHRDQTARASMRTVVGIAVVILAAACLATQALGQTDPGNLADDWLEDPTPNEAPEVEPTQPTKTSGTQLLKELYWQRFERSTGNKLKFEILLTLLIAAYIVNIFIGRRTNDRLAKAWAKTFCLPGGVFDKNFALIGFGSNAEVPLLKESASQYRLYCSGRRHCKSMNAVLKLKERQDLFSLVLGILFPTEDKLEIDVYMKEGSMPQTVLAIATKKAMRAMLAEETGEDDVRKFTKRLDVKTPGWPSDKLLIHGEHASIFEDLLTEPLLDQIFRRPAFETQSKYFRMLHFTPEQSYGPKDQRAVLRFSFAVPKEAQMEELTKLTSSVGVFIDLVGNFELGADLQKRATKIRQEVVHKEQLEKKGNDDAAEERRNAKRLEEAEKLKRMTPEQREKYKERKQKVLQGRQQRKYTKRM